MWGFKYNDMKFTRIVLCYNVVNKSKQLTDACNFKKEKFRATLNMEC